MTNRELVKRALTFNVLALSTYLLIKDWKEGLSPPTILGLALLASALIVTIILLWRNNGGQHP